MHRIRLRTIMCCWQRHTCTNRKVSESQIQNCAHCASVCRPHEKAGALKKLYAKPWQRDANGCAVVLPCASFDSDASQLEPVISRSFAVRIYTCLIRKWINVYLCIPTYLCTFIIFIQNQKKYLYIKLYVQKCPQGVHARVHP